MTNSEGSMLRPLSPGEILDQAIRLYRRNFLTFIGIIAMVQVPLTLVQLVFSLLSLNNSLQVLESPATSTPSDLFTPSYFIGIAGSLLTTLLGVILVQGIATAALTRAIAENRLGHKIGILEAYKRIGSAWLRILGALLLIILIDLALLVWFLIPCVGWLTGLGMLTFINFAVFPLVSPIIVLEGKNPHPAMRRAWDLARRRFWWMLGFVVILYLFAQLVISGPAMLLSWILGLALPQQLGIGSGTLIATMINSLVTMLMGLIYLPVQLSAITLLYFDLRVRTEGFDLLLRANEEASPGADILLLTSQAPPPASDAIITVREWGYFAAMTIFFGLAYTILVFGIIILGGLLFGASSGT
jgi:hypothetical protein